MNKSFINLIAFTFSFVCSIPAFSSQPASQHIEAEALPSYQIARERDDFLRNNNLSIGENRPVGERPFEIFWGQHEVHLPTGSIKFSDARLVAFEAALMKAKEAFLSDKALEISSTVLKSNFTDNQDLPQIKQLSDISIAIENQLASMNSELLSEISGDESSDSEEKKVLAKERIVREIIKKSRAVTSGIQIIKTFEYESSIGVLVVHSDDLVDLSKKLNLGIQVSLDNMPKSALLTRESALSFYDNNEHLLTGVMGLRIALDDNDNVVLLSFGQSGVMATKSDSKLKFNLALESARNMARSLAESQISDFIDSKTHLTDDSRLIGEAGIIESFSNGTITEKELLNVGKVNNRRFIQKSNAKLSGINTAKRWITNHPETGHLIVGEVIMWNPVQAKRPTDQAPSAPGEPVQRRPTIGF